jgi:hypothetical protein
MALARIFAAMQRTQAQKKRARETRTRLDAYGGKAKPFIRATRCTFALAPGFHGIERAAHAFIDAERMRARSHPSLYVLAMNLAAHFARSFGVSPEIGINSGGSRGAGKFILGTSQQKGGDSRHRLSFTSEPGAAGSQQI